MTDDNAPVDAGTSHATTVLEYHRALQSLTLGCRTPTDIAAKLLDNDCRGFLNSPCSCPVARYLRVELTVDSVAVSRTFVNLFTRTWFALDLPLPLIVTRFIEHFDHRRYPDLIETRTGV